ncbi:hypothetical protein AVEN_2229-1 [Araneus ventricosus]|uniref:Uncharacterized protein n=1 Tax=Araneus ventricosus TaxID=182803 RepID=A0A4Y2P736_ARAVE|nr:hypothetical protein AVEN_2229-1 [Araneus ventricosus]
MSRLSVVARRMDFPLSTVCKIARKVLLFYQYKIKLVEQYEPNDPAIRKYIALEFLAWIKVDEHWAWNILWTDEAHFYLNGDVNTRNYRIWIKQIRHVIHPVPLHSPQVTVWCGQWRFSAQALEEAASCFENLGPSKFDHPHLPIFLQNVETDLETLEQPSTIRTGLLFCAKSSRKDSFRFFYWYRK